MKKNFALILTVAMLFSLLAACGDSSKSSTSSAPAAASSAPAASSSAPATTGSTGVDPKEKEVTLSMSSFQKSGDAAEKILNFVFNEIYKRSGETIKIDYYANSTLCSQSNMLDGVLNDTTDMGYLQIADFGSRFPEVSMLEAPGIYFASAPAISYAFMEYVSTYKPAEMKDFILLSPTWGTVGTICANKGPIRAPGDLKGLTIRAAGNMAKSVTAFGGNPTDLAIADCYEALRTGVIDGIMTKPVAIGSFKLQEVLKYGIDYPLYNNGGMYIMNKDVFESLSDRQQEAITSAWKDAFDKCISKWQNDLEKEPGKMDFSKQMKEYYYPTDAEISVFKDAIKGIVVQYADSLTQKGMDGKAILQRWNDLADKYNKQYPYVAPSDKNFYIALDPATGERLNCSNPTWSLAY